MNRFAQRLRALAPTDRPRAEVPKVDVDDGIAKVRLYDPIDTWGEFWGISAKEFATTIDELPDDVAEIHLLINSPGGDVFDGIAILNAIRGHEARSVAVVEGLAASAASFIAAGCDEVVMARNSEMMIHDAWGVCVGNAEDMRQLADDLDRLSDNIASIYAERTGGDLAVWREAMRKETWYSAEEAVEAGLADRVETKTTAPKNRFDLSIYTYAGRRAAPPPAANSEPQAAPAPAASDPTRDARVDRFRHLVSTTRT